MNLAPIAGAVFGALAATPALAGGVLMCDPWHCRSTPYFPPPIVPVGPPVISTQIPYAYPPPPVVVPPPPPPVVVQPLPPVPPPACAAVSIGGLLNLRSWPNGPVLASYWPGTLVLIDGGNGGNWLHVVVGPVTSGWMYAPLLVPVPCGPVPLAAQPPPPPPPPPAAAGPDPPMTQDQQREDIIGQGEAFCRRYPHDPICHRPKDRPR
jgi:hypothetical protein